MFILNVLYVISISMCNFKAFELKQYDKENLILISFDGFRWDYLENNTLPNFKKYFVNQGAKVSHGLINACNYLIYKYLRLIFFSILFNPSYHGYVSKSLDLSNWSLS